MSDSNASVVKSYHLSDILSISTGRLVSTRHIEGVYDILDFMEGVQHTTLGLPAAADRVLPKLLEQLPFLKGIDGSKVTTENYKKWLAEMIVMHGEWHNIDSGVAKLPDSEKITFEELLSQIADHNKKLGFNIEPIVINYNPPLDK